MTGKPSLYACAAAVLLAGDPLPAVAAQDQTPPPCGACLAVGAGVRALSPDAPPESVALVLRPGEPVPEWFDAERARALLIEVEEVGAEAKAEQAFAVRRALVALRAAHPAARLGLLGVAAHVERLLAREIAPYLDVVAVRDDPATRGEGGGTIHTGLPIWRVAPFESLRDLLDASGGAGDGLVIWAPTAAIAPLARDIAALARLLPASLVGAPTLARCDPARACQIRTFQQADTLDTLVVVQRVLSEAATAILPAPPLEIVAVMSPVARDGWTSAVRPLAATLDGVSGAARVPIPAGVDLVIARVPSGRDRLAEAVHVLGARQLTAAEIVARHQAAAARQAGVVRARISHARSTVTFEVPVFPAPVTVQADTTIYEGFGPTELAQHNVRVNGVAFSPADVPRLPIIEPERVAAPPLTITLSRAYRYTLAGRERTGGRDAYVVAFTPDADRPESLFQGRAWIAVDSFSLLRVDAVQTNLRGSITSSQQIEDFREEVVDGQVVSLLARSELRQIYQGAGLTTPIHRVLVVDRHEVNPVAMAARRREAHASTAIMFRETGEGLRYLQPARSEESSELREVAGRHTRIRTVAGGLIIDPNITRPLPFAGVSYTDFDVLGTGAQLNAFFGGPYGQVAFSVPSIAGSRWQLNGEGFAMLARYNDRAFRDGRERYEENIRQRPSRARVGLVRPVTPRTTVHLAYVFDHTAFAAGDTTAAAFVVPADQVVHAARMALETQRGGWRIEGWWNPARRTGWREWGAPGAGDYRPGQTAFQRAGVSAGRPWVLGPRVLLRTEAAWMAGWDLDRFSRYAFGTFDNRLRGYPSASIRYDRGAVARTAVAWHAASRLRIDGFADLGVAREPARGGGHRGYPGVGAAVEAPGPGGLLLAAEWGYGLRGVNRDGRLGTHVMRLTAYKVF
jgi:hypothetical protein